ncbi:putative membrane protein [Natronincola peptidivorans]|uniref:Putative membrane protein n=1 Tax=Natronincola peptidivorans TaxID=426128 RepID=A0A1I0EX72_9FIRM|nr:DUF368 domain-containing protein [Natronincola peptidivorans]SET50082.1 putative membrane protein [Natronincola peptidivorans]
MQSIIQGVILGFIIVLPGMSGGTVFLIFGIYENMLKDLVKFNVRPYLPLLLGTIIGIFGGGMIFALFFEAFRDETAVFLMGCLIASIKPVLKGCPKVNPKRLIFLTSGLLLGLFMGGEPMGIVMGSENISWLLLFIGGAVSSAAMIIPGIPGSTILIVLGIYDNILFAIKELQLGILIFFGVGSLIGIFSLAKILNIIYEKYRSLISYFFAGLILGSSRALLPYTLDLSIVVIFIVGFGLVWIWSGKKDHSIDKLREDGT